MRGAESDAASGLRRGLSRLGIELREDELRPCIHFFLLHFLLLTFQYVCKAVRQATFLDALGAERLPWVYLLVALLSYPILRLYGSLTDRYPQSQLMRGGLGFVALSLLILRVFFDPSSALFGLVFYLWISLVSVFLISLFWSMTSQRFDPRQARRIFGLVGAGGLLGSMFGGQIARLVSQFGTTQDALVAAALALIFAALFSRPSRKGVPDSIQGVSSEKLGRARDGLQLVRQSPYLRRIALLMLLSTLVAQGIDLQFSWAIEQATGNLDQRTAVFGNLYSLTGIVAFLFQGLLTTRIHRRLGVGFALRLLPVLSGLGSVGFLLAAVLQPVWLLAAIWTLKVGDNALRYSLDQSTRELLFLPMAEAERPRAKAFIDVFVQRSAKGLAALGLLSVPLGWLSVVETVGFSLIAIVIWLLLISDLRKRYVASFRRGLRDPKPPAEPAEMRELATLEMLIERLSSADPREVLNALDLLVRHERGRLISPLMLHHEDASVRRRVLEILEHEKRLDALPTIEHLLSDPVAEVRVAAIEVLASFNPKHLETSMRDRLRDADPRLRGVAIRYLLVHGTAVDQSEVESRFADMIIDGSSNVRREAARVLSDLDRFENDLVRLLYDVDVEVCREAIRSVRVRLNRGDRSPLYAPILVSHLRHRKLKHRARETLVAYGPSILPALEHFLLDSHEGIWVRRALPKTIATIGGTQAVRALLHGLEARDLFLRRKVVESLVTLESRAQENGKSIIGKAQEIEPEICSEAKACSKIWLDLYTLNGATIAPGFAPFRFDRSEETLLLRLLAERLQHRLHNLFGLLALVYPMRDMHAAHLGLLSKHTEVRHHALEYLDNVLQGEVRRRVFAVIDDLPIEERLRQTQRLFGHSLDSKTMILERLVFDSPAQDADADGLAAAALCFVRHREIGPVQSWIELAIQEPSELVRETAEWLRTPNGSLPDQGTH